MFDWNALACSSGDLLQIKIQVLSPESMWNVGYQSYKMNLCVKWRNLSLSFKAGDLGRRGHDVQRHTDHGPTRGFPIHGKSVCKTWTLNPELGKTDLNFKYRSQKSVRVLNFSGTAVTFLKRRLHYCIFAYHFYTCFHKSNECEPANLKFNKL